MRYLIGSILFLLFFQSINAQKIIQGKIINGETGQPLAFANVSIGEDRTTLTDISGIFEIEKASGDMRIIVSYPGFFSKLQQLSSGQRYYLIQLIPQKRDTDRGIAFFEEKAADEIIKEAIKRKSQNDPEKALSAYVYKSYNKFVIDNQASVLKTFLDTSQVIVESVIEEGHGFLSEKVSSHIYSGAGYPREIINAIRTAGFEEPVYEVISMELEPVSLYKNEYPVFNTDYAGPLGKNALKNYSYKILDTVVTASRPAYLIYFKPKREEVVAGLEGVLYLDSLSYAIQKAKFQLQGEIQLNIEHNYEYFAEKDIWFPKDQKLVLKPGTGEKEISVFGGIIGLGTIQRQESLLTSVLPFGEFKRNLYLSSTTTNYDFSLEPAQVPRKPKASVWVEDKATKQSEEYWQANRQEPFSLRDKLTARRVDSIVDKRNIKRKLEIQEALVQGNFPLGFIDLDLGRILRFNEFEGYRAGFGGSTNEKFSSRYRIEGYAGYGFRDKAFKYSVDAGVRINDRSDTWIDIGYSDEIREIAGFDYLLGIDDFALFQPRVVKITDFYNEKNIRAGISHRITPRFETELVLGHNQISQLTDYRYFFEGREIDNYDIAEATIGILWRPFSRFLVNPKQRILIEKDFPRITAQVSQSIQGIAGGDLSFTKLAVRFDHRITRLNRSQTRFVTEMKYGFGDLPITHAFHSDPNNPEGEGIFERFSVAGNTSFETMYFNEFFSDRQVSAHIRHKFRPFLIFKGFEPELVLISRHVIGDLQETELHRNIEFQTLEKVYSEAGLEINKLLAGFGLSFAYRYGAYHLPSFRENFSLKFTFQLSL